MQIGPLCQRMMGTFLLGQFLMAHVLLLFVQTSKNMSPPPMELIKTKEPLAQIKFALVTSAEHEMPDNKKPIELPISRFPDPECSYQVHLDSPDGPLVNRKVSIGETLFHKWHCDYDVGQNETFKNSTGSLYCMMVHSCTISSVKHSSRHKGRHRRSPETAEIVLEIVDEFGCAIYTNITPQILYVGDLNALLEAQAFALDYDQTAVFFKCNVRLLLKINGHCRRPICA